MSAILPQNSFSRLQRHNILTNEQREKKKQWSGNTLAIPQKFAHK